jgi:iron complex outermembrane receptor protein
MRKGEKQMRKHPAASDGRRYGLAAVRRSGHTILWTALTALAAHALTLPITAATAWAQAETVQVADTAQFEIPASSLADAIERFGEQSGLRILYEPSLAENVQTPAISGVMSPDEALTQLLNGTGIVGVSINEQTFVLRRADAVKQGAQAGAILTPAEAAALAVADAGTHSAETDPGVNLTGESTTSSVETVRRGNIEEIIVTGQKREERIQDVPIAISAFSMDDLDNQKIEGGFDLLRGVPNVTFSKTNFSGYNFQIRGIGTQAISATTDPGVAVSFNNTTLIVNRLFEQEYLDIERVEVLRGPQGTLYGRNATGGVINVISAKPKLGVYEGEFKIETGNFNSQRLRGHYNLPLGDTVALRGAYAQTKRDGYGYNEYSQVDNPFRDRVSADVDDRDLWTGRLSLGWEPTPDLRVNLLYEHFNEDDRRTRTSKQLCHRDYGPGLPGTNPSGDFSDGSLSQGCKAGSLYSDDAFGTPTGTSLPYVAAMYWAVDYASGPLARLAGSDQGYGLGGSPYMTIPASPGNQPPLCGGFFPPCSDPTPEIPGPLSQMATCDMKSRGDQFAKRVLFPVDICNPDIYRGLMQSRDLRTISSQLEPKYQADSDIYEVAFDFQFSDDLMLSSQTVYAKDEYWATQDYNRFAAFPIWEDSSTACFVTVGDSAGGAGNPDCYSGAVFANGFYANLTPRAEGTPLGSPGILCDPQLGCSDTLLMQDLSRSTSKQFNQEIRLVSSFDAPVNFSLGANYTSFETMNDYFVFANGLTHLLNFFPFNYHNSRCVQTSSAESVASRDYDGQFCRYVDPNPLESINGEGHNYFRSGNPYKLRSTALFGEVYWQATESLKFTGGLRFTWDRKAFTPLPSQLLLADYREAPGVPEGAGPGLCSDIRTICPLAGTAPGGRGYLAEPDIVQEWRVPTGRLGFDWKPQIESTWIDQTMLYAFLSRGYKGGGANPPSVAQPAARFLQSASGGFAAPPTFKAEYVNAIEIGSKNTLFGGGLTLNMSAFYYDYSDYQISKILDRSAYNENFDATVWGLELESVFAPTPDTLFNASIGYLRTSVADGEQSIDLMDRTDGGNRHYAADPSAIGAQSGTTTDVPEGFDQWIVIKPWITASSNCIVPLELMESRSGLAVDGYCPNGNAAGGNSGSIGVPMFVYDEDGNQAGTRTAFYDPSIDAPNGGQGFYKDLSGNELPNAPRFTVSLGGQQTFYLPANWQLTTRLDWYWQDQSYARIYNMEGYDRLKTWSSTNLSLWVEKPEWGLKVETYVKNLFDETPITGAFLNSDDSGLTTNVFTLDPRLFGLSITKRF